LHDHRVFIGSIVSQSNSMSGEHGTQYVTIHINFARKLNYGEVLSLYNSKQFIFECFS